LQRRDQQVTARVHGRGEQHVPSNDRHGTFAGGRRSRHRFETQPAWSMNDRPDRDGYTTETKPYPVRRQQHRAETAGDRNTYARARGRDAGKIRRPRDESSHGLSPRLQTVGRVRAVLRSRVYVNTRRNRNFRTTVYRVGEHHNL